MNIKKQSLKILDALKDIDKDDVLEQLGLQERSSGVATAFGTIGVFALGCLVGAGLGLAFAPKAGTELRNDLSERVRRKASELPIGEGAGDYPNSTRSQVPMT